MCVTAFPLSQNREAIMSGLEAVVQHLEQARVVGDLWINGSFLTEAIEPGDADVVLRVTAEFFDSATPEIQGFLNEWFRPGMAAKAHHCDAFLFCEFPPGHPYHCDGIQQYWVRQYGTGHDEVTPKGIAVVAVGGGVK